MMTPTDSAGVSLGALAIRDAEAVDGERLPPSLLIRCSGEAFAVYIDWKTALAGDSVSVTYSLGDSPEQTETWTASSDGRAAGLWTEADALPLLQEMVAHETMRVSVEAAEGVQTRTFPLDGLDEVSGQLRDVCEPAPEDSLASV